MGLYNYFGSVPIQVLFIIIYVGTVKLLTQYAKSVHTNFLFVKSKNINKHCFVLVGKTLNRFRLFYIFFRVTLRLVVK